MLMVSYLFRNQSEKMDNNRGFTLLEVLIVLGIWSVLMLLVTPFIFEKITEHHEEKFMETLEYDLLYMQRYATLTKGKVYLHLKEGGYAISESSYKAMIERKMPANWEVGKRTLKSISFDENGRVRQPGNMMIKTGKANYRIVLPLGKGRAYIVKE